MSPPWSTAGTVRVNGVRLGCREAGDPAGVPAVLLHGTGSSAGTWDRFTPRLTAAGYRVIAIELRGHAASERIGDYSLTGIRDDVLDLLATRGLRDVVLIGHSVGAYAALAVARHSPERITRLVLEDVAAPPRRFGMPRLLTAAGSSLAALSDRKLGVTASIVFQLLRADPDWWARLHDVRQPTLVFSGGPTSCIPPRRMAEVTAAIPGARLVTIPVGHRVHSLAPDEFGDQVTAFLARSASSLAA